MKLCGGPNPSLNRSRFFRLIEENTDMRDDDVLVPSDASNFKSELWLWLDVLGEEYPLDITGHYPILAGFDTSGMEMYIARVDPFHSYAYVSNGARSVTVTDRRGTTMVVNRFEVMVLKHDPCDIDMQVIPKDVMFQTGPFYWIRGEASSNPRANNVQVPIKPSLSSNSRSDSKVKGPKVGEGILDDSCSAILRCSR